MGRLELYDNSYFETFRRPSCDHVAEVAKDGNAIVIGWRASDGATRANKAEQISAYKKSLALLKTSLAASVKTQVYFLKSYKFISLPVWT